MNRRAFLTGTLGAAGLATLGGESPAMEFTQHFPQERKTYVASVTFPLDAPHLRYQPPAIRMRAIRAASRWFIHAAANVTGTINNQPIQGHPRESLLCMGLTMRRDDGGNLVGEIRFQSGAMTRICGKPIYATKRLPFAIGDLKEEVRDA